MSNAQTKPFATTGLSALALGTAATLTAFPVLTLPAMLVFSAIVWRLVQP
ncbi:MAG: hypothetical protein AAFX58_05285 [Pseudomonadota bacterium]